MFQWLDTIIVHSSASVDRYYSLRSRPAQARVCRETHTLPLGPAPWWPPKGSQQDSERRIPQPLLTCALHSDSARVRTSSLSCYASPTLPAQQFQGLFHSLFKVLFIFRSLYLFAIGLGAIFSLRRNTPASLHSTLKLRYSWIPPGPRALPFRKRKVRSGFAGGARPQRDARPHWSYSRVRFAGLPRNLPFGPCTTIPRLPAPSGWRIRA